MRKLLIPIIMGIAAALCLATRAQSQSLYSIGADSALRLIDKSPITSGYLYDRAIPVSRYDVFDPAADTSSYMYAMQVYLELYQAAYAPQRMTMPEKLTDMVTMQNLQNRVPVQVLDYIYQQINPMALQDGLLSYAGGVLNNTAGNPNPYITKRLQLSSLLAERVESPTITFVLLPHFISRNTGLNVQQVQLSAAGMNVVLNGPLDSVTVTLPGVGRHFITVTTTLSNGSQFSTLNELVIGEDNTNNRTAFEAPPACFTTAFEGNIPWQGYEDNRPYRGKFDLSIYYRDGVDCIPGTARKIMKPVILIDGFDGTDKRTAENRVLYSKFLRFMNDVNFIPPKEEDFVKEIQLRGFDVILVDIPTYFYTNTGQIIPLDANANNPPPGYTLNDGAIIRGGGDYVERNALTMVALLQDINNQLLANGSIEKIVLIGPSMGGQITRYALKYMEDRNLNHNVRLWVSQDSNHEGAVLPIGEQMVIDALAKSLKSAEIARDRQLMVPAARQFLLDHFTAHPQYGAGDAQPAAGSPGYQSRFQHVMDSIGWPQQCRKIASISGAENGSSLAIPSAGELAMNITGKTQLAFPNLLAPIFVNLACIQVPGDGRCTPLKVNMYTAPAPGKVGKVASLDIYKLVNTEFYTKGATYTKTQSLETAQSGFYWGYKELGDMLPNFLFDNRSNALLSVSSTIPGGHHTHQPTGSTLAYGRGSNPNVYDGYHFKWDEDVTPYNLGCDGYIPFDAYFGPKTFSVLHDSIIYNQAQTLISEIAGIIPEYPKPKRTIFIRKTDNTKHYFCPGETLQFYAEINLPGMAVIKPTWTINSNKFEIISGQGTPAVAIKYLGGMSYDEYMALGSIKISVAEEAPCYRLSASRPVEMGVGDIWSGTITGTTTGQGWPLNYAPGYNMSDRANVKIIGALTFKENNLQQYSLIQNTHGTTINWNVMPVTVQGATVNQLNITSDIMGEYLFKISDVNRCSAKVNSFVINFSRNLQWRITPNPVNSEMTITKLLPADIPETNKPAVIQFSVLNLYSKQPLLIKSAPNTQAAYRIPVSNLPEGEYVLQIQYGTQLYNEKLLIKR